MDQFCYLKPYQCRLLQQSMPTTIPTSLFSRIRTFTIDSIVIHLLLMMIKRVGWVCVRGKMSDLLQMTVVIIAIEAWLSILVKITA